MSNKHALCISILAAFLGVAFQAHAATGESGAREAFIGRYILSFEVSAFEPLAPRGERYWASGPALDQLRAALLQKDKRGYGEVSVSVCGTLSKRGRYGHLGQYPHELSVQRIIAVGFNSPFIKSEC